jgi:polar amino acid transport system substrate-binding protein
MNGAWSRVARIRIGAVLFGIGLVSAAAAQQVLTIGRQVEDSLMNDISEQVLRIAFQRAGLSFNSVRLPLPRSIEDANDGAIDGDLHRIADVARLHPNVIQVPTPINRVDVAMYGNSDAIRTKTRAQVSLLRVVVPRGTLLATKYLSGMKVTVGQTRDTIFEMLAQGRVDCVFISYLDVESELTRRHLNGLVLWPHLWASEPIYLMLNKRHAALVPRLDAALQQMKAEGLIDRTYNDALRQWQIAPLLYESGVSRGGPAR